MTAPNRVDDLRKRYHENPRRFFAPLANEYRKTGFIDRAILLCEKHLEEQPGNMNGLIVYGQCLYETGRLEDARAPFEAALAVDPENLIALRHLGDIARLGMDPETARGWYQRVLEFDRRNDEVIALLAEVSGGVEPPSAPAPSIPANLVSVAPSVSLASAEPVPESASPAPAARPSLASLPPIDIEAANPAPPIVDHSAKTVEVSAQRPPKRGSLFDLDFDFGESGQASTAMQAANEALDSIVAEAPSAPPPALDPPRPVTADAPLGRIIDEVDDAAPLAETSPLDGFELAEFSADVSPMAELESTEFVGGDAAMLDGLESLDFLVPTSEPPADAPAVAPAVAPASEWDDAATAALEEGPSAGLPLLPEFGDHEESSTRASATEGIPLLPSLEEAETLRIDVEDLRRRFETPATFVTETMAELYVQQGLHEKAIDVYRQLIVQSPGDQGLQDRLFALEHGVAQPVEPVAEEASFAAEPPAAAPDDFPEYEDEPLAPVAPAPRTTAPRVTLDFETPVVSDAVVEAPAPANAMLSEMSFADVLLTTPQDARRSAPLPAGPSAREFFSAFARRALTPLSMMVVSAVPSAAGGPLSPLDEIFGLAVDATDESAAHVLAAIGATSGPSGGSALDSIFGEGPSAPMPAESPSATPPRGSVPRASAKLRFDQFFASSVASATPSSSEAVLESEPASAEAPEAPSAPEPETPGDDDLDQFQGWLRRLTQ